MKLILIIVMTITVLICPCIAISSVSIPGDQIIGIWMTNVKDAKVQVYRDGDVYYGKIIWLEQQELNRKSPLLDNLNPNPKLRKRTRENIIALTGLSYCGDNKYNNGVIYYPTNGNTYGCNATMVSNNKLKLRAYLGLSFIGQSIYFTRVK